MIQPPLCIPLVRPGRAVAIDRGSMRNLLTQAKIAVGRGGPDPDEGAED